MPYITDTAALNCPFLDKRSKLLPCQKEMIIYYSNAGYSQRKLAAMFNVSRRLIQFVINPEMLQGNKDARRQRGGEKQYYDRLKHNSYMKAHRQRKYSILKGVVSNFK